MFYLNELLIKLVSKVLVSHHALLFYHLVAYESFDCTSMLAT